MRCGNEICEITNSTQNFVRDKHSDFTTEMGKVTLEQQPQPVDNKKRKGVVLLNLLESKYSNVETSITEKIPDKSLYHGIVLDQHLKVRRHFKKAKLQEVRQSASFVLL